MLQPQCMSSEFDTLCNHGRARWTTSDIWIAGGLGLAAMGISLLSDAIDKRHRRVEMRTRLLLSALGADGE